MFKHSSSSNQHCFLYPVATVESFQDFLGAEQSLADFGRQLVAADQQFPRLVRVPFGKQLSSNWPESRHLRPLSCRTILGE